jgi:Lon protease-like protein
MRPADVVPVFPLPDVVLFPHARLALHVFELRYRTMVRDALSRGRVIGIATLLPGWEHDYHGSPAFHPVGCLARFDQVEWLPNDCYDLQVEGVERIRFGRMMREFPYRACEIERLPASPFEADDPLAEMERRALLETSESLMERGPAAWTALPVTAADASFETIVNTHAQSLRIATSARLELLEMDSVFDRARRLHEHMVRLRHAPLPPTGPPEQN